MKDSLMHNYLTSIMGRAGLVDCRYLPGSIAFGVRSLNTDIEIDFLYISKTIRIYHYHNLVFEIDSKSPECSGALIKKIGKIIEKRKDDK